MCAFSNIPGEIYQHDTRDGNQNPHHTLFAGEPVFTGDANGLGLIWLMLRERHLGGTIIFADLAAYIRYSRPIPGKTYSHRRFSSLSGDRIVWQEVVRRAFRDAGRVFGDDTPVWCLKALTLCYPQNRLAHMKKAGTRKSKSEGIFYSMNASAGRLKRSASALIWLTVSALRPFKMLLTFDFEPSSLARSAALRLYWSMSVRNTETPEGVSPVLVECFEFRRMFFIFTDSGTEQFK